MKQRRAINTLALARVVSASTLGVSTAFAYSVPDSTPPGITLVDVSMLMAAGGSKTIDGIPQFLWRRLGDANGNPLYTRDADQDGKSSCSAECAREFPPFTIHAHAKPTADFSIIRRDDHLRQWAYQGKPLYRYAGRNPIGEPVGERFQLQSQAWFDTAANTYAPKQGWRRAAYTPEKSVTMPPTVELDALAVANGFGFVDAATRMTLYVSPLSHKLSGDWRPLQASALALRTGKFSIVKRKDDGARQWAYQGAGLYTYAGDYAPGEITGIFAGDKDVQAALAYRNFMPPGAMVGQHTGRGPLLTTTQGMTLYTEARYYTQYGGRETRTGYSISYNQAKSLGPEGCQGDCTATWKPFLAPENAQASGGFWETIVRPEGTKQWLFKGSPVYSYVGDQKPGDVQSNNRHVIVYGGREGQIVYASAGRDPRVAGLSLGKINMQDAVGSPDGRESDGGRPRAEHISAGGVSAGGVSASGVPATAPPGEGVPVAVRGRGAPDPGAARGEGAGLYWHVIGLFY